MVVLRFTALLDCRTGAFPGFILEKMVVSICSELAVVSALFFEEVCYFQLCPDKVSVISDLIDQLPPEAPSHDTFDDCRVVSKSYKELKWFIAILPMLDKQSIREIDPKDEVPVAIES
jgi:hypothetical protein